MKRRLIWWGTFLGGLYFFLEFVLPAEFGGDFDDHTVTAPAVVYDGTKFRMWYAGYPEDRRSYIGLATSADGQHWTKETPRGLIRTSTFNRGDYYGAEAPCVLYQRGIYHMWYVGWDFKERVHQLCYAQSRDGYRWEKCPLNPVVTVSKEPGKWDHSAIEGASVIWADGAFHMWYVGVLGSVGQVGYAVSDDGANWANRQLEPVLHNGENGSWDHEGITAISVLRQGDRYRMWYLGSTKEQLDPGKEDQSEIVRVGYAESKDGYTWEKHPGNPVFSLSYPVQGTGLVALQPVVESVGGSTEVVDEGRYVLVKLPKGKQTLLTVGSQEQAPDPGPGCVSRVAAWVGDFLFASRGFVAQFVNPPLRNPETLCVVKVGEEYKLWFSSAELGSFKKRAGKRIAVATSKDGLHWQTEPKGHAPRVVLDLGRPSRSTYLTKAQSTIGDWWNYAAAFAVGMGLINLSTMHGANVRRRKKGWGNSLAFFVSVILMFAVTLWYKQWEKHPQFITYSFNALFWYVYNPLGSTMFSLLACYLASASYRAMRIRNFESGLLMVSALIIMLGQVPTGAWFTRNAPSYLQIPTLAKWILYVGGNAAVRAVGFGSFVGGLAISLRIWLGLERGAFFDAKV